MALATERRRPVDAVGNRHPFAGFPSSVEKLWAGSSLLDFEAVHGFSTERQRQ